MTNDPNHIWNTPPGQSSGNRSNSPDDRHEIPIDSVAALERVSNIFEQLITEYQNTRGYGRTVGRLSALRKDIADRKWDDLDYLNENNIDEFLRNLDRLMSDSDHDLLMSAYLDVILPEATELAEARRVEMPTIISPSVALMRAQIEALETQPASPPPPEPTTSTESDANGIILYWSSLNRRTKILVVIAAILIALAGFLLVSFLLSSNEESTTESINTFADGGEVITLPTLFPTGTPIILATAPNPNTSAGFCLQVTRMPRDYCYGPNPPQDGSCSNPEQYWTQLPSPYYTTDKYLGLAILVDKAKWEGTPMSISMDEIYYSANQEIASWLLPFEEVNIYSPVSQRTVRLVKRMNGPDMMQTVTFIGGDGTVITEPPKFAISDGLRDALGLSGPGPFLLEVTRTCALGSGY